MLREAGFVQVRGDGQRHIYTLDAAPLAELDAWLARYRRFWASRLDDSAYSSPQGMARAAGPNEAAGGVIDAPNFVTPWAPSAATVRATAQRCTLERDFDATPAQVWRFLTHRARTGRWLHAAVELEPRAGGTIILRFTNTDTTVQGRIARFDAPNVLEYTWRRANEPETLVRFELRPNLAAPGTRLALTHSRCDGAAAGEMAAGWHHHLELLAAQLAVNRSPGTGPASKNYTRSTTHPWPEPKPPITECADK